MSLYDGSGFICRLTFVVLFFPEVFSGIIVVSESFAFFFIQFSSLVYGLTGARIIMCSVLAIITEAFKKYLQRRLENSGDQAVVILFLHSLSPH